MKIALLSTPWISIPPKGYGGIELVVANLADELVQQGHDVTIFATGESQSRAHIRYIYTKALGNNLFAKNNPYPFLQHIHAFFKYAQKERFDIIHNHAQYFPMFFFDLQDTPFVHTLHGAFYKTLQSPSGLVESKREVLKQFKKHAFISISNNQRIGMPSLHYVATVYNGIRPENFTYYKAPGRYLAWLGRITPNKGVDIAIRIARSLDIPLKIAAFIDPGDQDYFDSEIKPLLNSQIQFTTEIQSMKDKRDFLGNAMATLFPIRWDEPFGLVMIESMACGTPVIAFNKGSVPEIVQHQKTGYVVNTEKEMAQAVKKIGHIDRRYCHTHTIEHFSVKKMTRDYLKTYQHVITHWTR